MSSYPVLRHALTASAAFDFTSKIVLKTAKLHRVTIGLLNLKLSKWLMLNNQLNEQMLMGTFLL